MRSKTFRLRLRFGIAFNIIAIIAIVIPIYQLINSNKEATRLRNALVAQVTDKNDFKWLPNEVPSDFLIEQGDVPSRFRELAEDIIGDNDKHTNFEKALLVADHLAGVGRGPGIHSNTVDTYEQMSQYRRGHCSDFSQVFNGIAFALGIPVREWHLAWRGFGVGHAFNEIFDYTLDKWIFIDTYYSFYVVDAGNGIPLSVLEFQERLRDKARWDQIRVIPIVDAKFRFRPPEKAVKVYANGSDQFFLWWGNNVFTYDDHPLVKIIDPMSRSLAQAAAILLGVQPEMHIVRTETNQEHIDELWRIKNTFYTYIILLSVMAGLLLFQLWIYKRGDHVARRLQFPSTHKHQLK